MRLPKLVMAYVDPPLIPTRWWLPLRLLQRSVPLIGALLPTAAYVEPKLFWGLVALLEVVMLVLAGWSVASTDATGWRRAVARAGNTYVGFAFSGLVLIGVTAPLTRPEPLSAERTLLITVLLYTLTLLGEKMMTRGAGKPVRPDSQTEPTAPESPPQTRICAAPGLVDVVAVMIVVLAAWRPRRPRVLR